MEKSKPHFALANIKSQFADPARLNRTFLSRQSADDLGLDDDGVVAIIQALQPRDFDKSMTSHADHRIWQDVYKPSACNRTLYLKFTLDARRSLLLISFKEA